MLSHHQLDKSSPTPPLYPDVNFALQAAEVGTWDLDIMHKQVRWDEHCKIQYGFDKDDIVPYEQVLSYMHPDDRSRVDAAVQWGLNPQSQGRYDIEFRTLGASDGRLRWLHCRGQAFFNEQGEAYRFSGIAQEVTRLVQAHQQLDSSQARFADLVMATPVATAVFIGRDMTIQQANAPMLAIWGKESSVIGKTLHQAMPELDGQPFLAQLQHVFDTGEPFRHDEGMADVIENGQRKRVWFNHAYNPFYEATGQIYGVINVAIDVTAQVLARQKIEESEAHLLRDTVPAMIFYLDAQQRYQSYNKVFRQWFGVGDEVMGKSAREFIGEPAYQEMEPYLAKAYTGQQTQYELHAPTRMNADRWLSIVYTPHPDPQGQVLGVIVHATDITPSKRMELSLSASETRYRTLSADLEQQVQSRTDELATANQELAASNQELATSNHEYAVLNTHLEEANTDLIRSNQNLEQFAYIASHDLQEPLRKIQQFGDLLQTRLADSAGGEELAYLGRMQVATRRMSLLIKDLLAFSRIATSQVVAHSVSLGEVVQLALDSLSVVIEESRAQIIVAELPTVRGDELQLSQLFQNLLSNALKFRRTAKEGTLVAPQVQVQARLILHGELPALVKPPRYATLYHLIEVTDNGIGFDEKYLDRIFQVFQRLHGKNEFAGTGVGLAIVQKVVTNHGGAITATSQSNQGATFCVYLPA